jgi:diguanylate cyclase (GGDEF)-like protein
VVVAPITDANGFPARLIVISRDITDQKEAEEKAQWAANHDPLTQLPNRFLLQQGIDAELERAETLGGGFALMMLDVDHLKRVNDSLGHDGGDGLLLEFAGRLKSAIREGDTVARLGGDEFAIILAGASTVADVEAVAEQISAALAAPFAFGGRMVDCHASIGVSLFPGHGQDRAELMKNADVALYAAKSSARGSLKIFDPAMREEMQKHSSMLALAKAALKNDWVLPHYQPKVDLNNGRIEGYEALLRWSHPSKGIQMPASHHRSVRGPDPCRRDQRSDGRQGDRGCAAVARPGGPVRACCDQRGRRGVPARQFRGKPAGASRGRFHSGPATSSSRSPKPSSWGAARNAWSAP